MAAEVMHYCPADDAEALRVLRASFAEAPLSMRVAALELLMRGRWRRDVQLFR